MRREWLETDYYQLLGVDRKALISRLVDVDRVA